jgi:hypothetical protein
MNTPPTFYPGQLTHKDVQAVRKEIESSGFVHLPRLAQMWGVSEETIKHAAGRLLKRTN